MILETIKEIEEKATMASQLEKERDEAREAARRILQRLCWKIPTAPRCTGNGDAYRYQKWEKERWKELFPWL